MRLPPTPCRVCFRPCVFNKFSHFWQKPQRDRGYCSSFLINELSFSSLEMNAEMNAPAPPHPTHPPPLPRACPAL